MTALVERSDLTFVHRTLEQQAIFSLARPSLRHVLCQRLVPRREIFLLELLYGKGRVVHRHPMSHEFHHLPHLDNAECPVRSASPRLQTKHVGKHPIFNNPVASSSCSGSTGDRRRLPRVNLYCVTVTRYDYM